jgi:predicted porin
MEIKTIRMLAIPALLLSCGSVYAQSSVTLYGLIDEGIDFTNNAGSGSAVRMQSGDYAGSRWGVKGSEDLGGGTKAIFLLENGFDVNSGELGQADRMFGRQAYVGLTSTNYGSLTLGRQYDPTVDIFSPMVGAGNWGNVSAVPFDNDNADWDFRVNNSVKYVSPTIAGFTGEAMYGFSNSTGFADNRLYSLAGQYKYGGLSAVFAYMKINNPGNGTSGALVGDEVFTGSSQENIDAALGYRWEKAFLSASYSRTKIDSPSGNAYLSGSIAPANGGNWTDWTFDNFQIMGQYYFQPSFWLGATYTYTMGGLDTTAGNYKPKWHQGALMLDYDLSKRTTFYVQAAYQHVVSANTGTQFDNAQIVGAAGVSSSRNQMLYRAAIVHTF